MTDVTVNQLTSKNGHSGIDTYLNVDQGDGHIGVWGNLYINKAILAQRGNTYCLITFDSELVYNEWMEENSKSWDLITTLSDVGEIIQNNGDKK